MLGTLSYPKLSFPKNFLWGSATSAYQVEGNDIHSHNWKEGLEGKCYEPCGNACNNFELYQQDVALIRSLGHQAFRLSIPWSRIEPEEGHFDSAAVAHYQDYLQKLHDAGIQTFVTLSHGSDPEWFHAKYGAFEKRENLHFFDRYVNYIVPLLDPGVDFYLTINEINIMGGCGGFAAMPLRRNYMIAHAHAFQIIRSYTSKPISAPHAMIPDMPVDPNFKPDRVLAEMEDWADNEFFIHALRTGELVSPYCDMEYIPELKNAYDFWAINYYTRTMHSARHAKRGVGRYTFARKNLVDTTWNMTEFYPEGLTVELRRFNDGKPFYITENGICAEDDRWRILKLAQDLAAIYDAIQAGVDVRGYLHWSLLDNYEWLGFEPKYGMVAVDLKTFERTPKPSAYFLRDVIANNALSGDLVQKYLPDFPVPRCYWR